MPTYSYRCTECGHKFDLFHSMSDTSEKECPQCGCEAERQIGGGIGVGRSSSGGYSYTAPAPALPRFT